MTGHIMLPRFSSSALSASACRVETPTHSISLPKARPFTAEIPILTPVNEPGPALTAMHEMSSSEMCAFLRQKSIIGRRLSLWVSVLFTWEVTHGISFSPSDLITPAAAVFAVVSSDRIYIKFPLFYKHVFTDIFYHTPLQLSIRLYTVLRDRVNKNVIFQWIKLQKIHKKVSKVR